MQLELYMSTAPPTRLSIETNYETHKAEWLQSHRDEFVVVKDSEVLGFFASFHEAYSAGVEKHGTDADFLVKRVVPQEPVFVMF
jgi:hypothetical protein